MPPGIELGVRDATGRGCGAITFGEGLYRRESNIADRWQ